ncbi:hypothetical protein HWV62_30925 [Athelia sp. TMB]|nr:hypothetical protein HWV62_30925 [Athelia sp. TMB]
MIQNSSVLGLNAVSDLYVDEDENTSKMQSILDTAVEKLKLDAERPFFAPIARTIVNITNRSEDDHFAEKCRRLIKGSMSMVRSLRPHNGELDFNDELSLDAANANIGIPTTKLAWEDLPIIVQDEESDYTTAQDRLLQNHDIAEIRLDDVSYWNQNDSGILWWEDTSTTMLVDSSEDDGDPSDIGASLLACSPSRQTLHSTRTTVPRYPFNASSRDSESNIFGQLLEEGLVPFDLDDDDVSQGDSAGFEISGSPLASLGYSISADLHSDCGLEPEINYDFGLDGEVLGMQAWDDDIVGMSDEEDESMLSV